MLPIKTEKKPLEAHSDGASGGNAIDIQVGV
jgi:hypothetical protein